MMDTPDDVKRAFRNLDSAIEDQLVGTLRSNLRDGLIESKQIIDSELKRLRERNEQIKQIMQGKVMKTNTAQQPVTTEVDTEKPKVMKTQTAQVPATIIEAVEKPKGIQKPSGPIEIGRPYPVFIICYECGIRVLTQVERDSDESMGCCGGNSKEDTVIHSCPLCGILVGTYKK